MEATAALVPAAAALQARPIGPAVPWPVVVDAFIKVRVPNRNTARSYRRCLTEALTAIGKRTMEEITGLDLANYRAQLLQDGRAPGTKALVIAALRAFFKWARRPHVGACDLLLEVIEDALERSKGKVQRPYDVLTDPEITEAIRAAASARDRALLGIMVGAGLRVSEVAMLDVEHVREAGTGCGKLYVKQGKGNKDREVPAPREVILLVRTYLAETGRTVRADGALFLSTDRAAHTRSRTRMSDRAIRDSITQALEAAGVEAKQIACHGLRHTFAIRYLRNGGNIMALARILGHASIATTQKYLDHLLVEDLTASMPPLPLPAELVMA